MSHNYNNKTKLIVITMLLATWVAWAHRTVSSHVFQLSVEREGDLHVVSNKTSIQGKQGIQGDHAVKEQNNQEGKLHNSINSTGSTSNDGGDLDARYPYANVTQKKERLRAVLDGLHASETWITLKRFSEGPVSLSSSYLPAVNISGDADGNMLVKSLSGRTEYTLSLDEEDKYGPLFTFPNGKDWEWQYAGVFGGPGGSGQLSQSKLFFRVGQVSRDQLNLYGNMDLTKIEAISTGKVNDDRKALWSTEQARRRPKVQADLAEAMKGEDIGVLEKAIKNAQLVAVPDLQIEEANMRLAELKQPV